MPENGNIIKEVVNGPVRKTAEWAMSVNTVHPSMHRLKNALGLTVGMLLGRKTMDLVAGATLDGNKINPLEVPLPLRPIVGIMPYDHFSDDPKDRWMKVVDNWVPAAFAAAGAVLGAHEFAMNQKLVQESTVLLKEAEAGIGKNLTLDNVETAAQAAQAWPWRALSGVTSVFGSASGFALIPGPENMGASLGASFLGTVERNKLHTPYFPWLQEYVSGNIHNFAYGPTSMTKMLREYLVQNTERNPERQREMAYAILEPWFGKEVNQKHVTQFVEELTKTRDRFFKEGGIPEEMHGKAREEMNKLVTGIGLEKTFQKIGLDPENAMIGRNGMIEYLSKLMGAEKRITALETEYRGAYRARNGLKEATTPVVQNNLTRMNDRNTLLSGGIISLGAGLGVGSMALKANEWHARDNDLFFGRDKKKPDTAVTNANVSNIADKSADKADGNPSGWAPIKGTERLSRREKKAQEGMLNGSVLPVLEWGANAMNSPFTLGSHRVMCALGLTAGGYTGMQLSNTLFGRTLSGEKFPIEKVPEYMRALHNKFPYNPYSDHPHDRWGYVFHFLIPAITASAGVITASTMFFQKKQNTVANARFIDEFDEKANMAEAKPWTNITALSSLFVTPSGFPYLPFPFPNYGTALHSRFALSAGRKIIFPGIGEFWTGNHSRYPYGPSRLRDMMVDYAVHNKSEHPEQIEEMALGILRPWFKDITPEQVDKFVEKVEADRDKFLKNGGVPEELQESCERELLKHFKGAGLEQTLREIGVDPSTAILGNNGFAGEVAKICGAKQEMNDIKEEFTTKYTARLQKEQREQSSSGHLAV